MRHKNVKPVLPNPTYVQNRRRNSISTKILISLKHSIIYLWCREGKARIIWSIGVYGGLQLIVCWKLTLKCMSRAWCDEHRQDIRHRSRDIWKTEPIIGNISQYYSQIFQDFSNPRFSKFSKIFQISQTFPKTGPVVISKWKECGSKRNHRSA